MFCMTKNSKLPYLKVNLTIPLLDICDEAQNLLAKGMYEPHRSDDGEGWNVFTLFGEGEYITIGGNWGDPTKYHWTNLAKKYCPKTIEWLQSLPYTEIYRARFMFLEPHGHIKIHHDKEPQEHLGDTVIDDAMNIAIKHPQGCYMRQVYKDYYNEVPFKDGTAFFFNNRYFHYVHNNSNETRIHMIIHAKWLPLHTEYPDIDLVQKNYLDHENFAYSNNPWNDRKALDEKISAYTPDLSHYC